MGRVASGDSGNDGSGEALRQAQGERGITILRRAQGERTPLPRTSGYRLSPVRRGGRGCGAASAHRGGGEGPAAAGWALREAPLRPIEGRPLVDGDAFG